MLSGSMAVPSIIQIYFSEGKPPLVCHSLAEMDESLDRLDAETRARLQGADPGDPLAVTIAVPGYQIYTGLGAEQSYISIGVEPCDGEYYTAVGEETATGESLMFYGSGQDSYWRPKNLLSPQVARRAVRYFVEHQQRSPELRWQDWDEREV